MKRVVHSKEFIDALIASEIVRTDDLVHRVIIEARVDHVVTIYVERYGDERLYSLIPALAQVTVAERVVGEEPETADAD